MVPHRQHRFCSALTSSRSAAHGQDADTNAVAQHEAELARVLDYYEEVLEKQSWLAGKASMPGAPEERCGFSDFPTELQSHRRVPHPALRASGSAARIRRAGIRALLSQSLVGPGAAEAGVAEGAGWVVSGGGDVWTEAILVKQMSDSVTCLHTSNVRIREQCRPQHTRKRAQLRCLVGAVAP